MKMCQRYHLSTQGTREELCDRLEAYLMPSPKKSLPSPPIPPTRKNDFSGKKHPLPPIPSKMSHKPSLPKLAKKEMKTQPKLPSPKKQTKKKKGEKAEAMTAEEKTKYMPAWLPPPPEPKPKKKEEKKKAPGKKKKTAFMNEGSDELEEALKIYSWYTPQSQATARMLGYTDIEYATRLQKMMKDVEEKRAKEEKEEMKQLKEDTGKKQEAEGKEYQAWVDERKKNGLPLYLPAVKTEANIPVKNYHLPVEVEVEPESKQEERVQPVEFSSKQKAVKGLKMETRIAKSLPPLKKRKGRRGAREDVPTAVYQGADYPRWWNTQETQAEHHMPPIQEERSALVLASENELKLLRDAPIEEKDATVVVSLLRQQRPRPATQELPFNADEDANLESEPLPYVETKKEEKKRSPIRNTKMQQVLRQPTLNKNLRRRQTQSIMSLSADEDKSDVARELVFDERVGGPFYLLPAIQVSYHGLISRLNMVEPKQREFMMTKFQDMLSHPTEPLSEDEQGMFSYYSIPLFVPSSTSAHRLWSVSPRMPEYLSRYEFDEWYCFQITKQMPVESTIQDPYTLIPRLLCSVPGCRHNVQYLVEQQKPEKEGWVVSGYCSHHIEEQDMDSTSFLLNLSDPHPTRKDSQELFKWQRSRYFAFFRKVFGNPHPLDKQFNPLPPIPPSSQDQPLPALP